MRKIGKRTLSLLLAVLMVTALFTAVPLTVSAAQASDEAVAAENGTVAGTIEINDTKMAYISDSGYKFYSFTPDRDMIIWFYSDYSNTSYTYNPCGVICDANMNGLRYASTGGMNNNFSIRYSVKADTQYYLGVKNVRSYYFNCPVTLEELPVWEHENGVITAYNGEDENIEIPSELDGETITEIGEGVFKYKDTIKSVVIPAAVTAIGKEAFYCCTDLSTVSFAENSALETIGDSAFIYCESLETVNFEALKNLKTIGDSAFAADTYKKNKLTYVNLQEGLTTIGTGAFNNSGSGKGFIIIPSTVTNAGCNGNNQTAFYMARYNTIIIKTQENIFDIDFDAAMYIPYAACYEDSPVEYQLEHGSNTSPSVGSAYHIKSQYTVTYDANLPDSVPVTVPDSQSYSDDVINISSEVPAAGGKREFLGWSTDPYDSQPRFRPGDKAAFCADVTLYAVWRDTVTFIDGDVTVTNDIALKDKPGSGSFTYNNVNAVRDGKVLMGYFTEQNGEGTLMFVKGFGDNYVTLAEGVSIQTVMSAADNEGEVKLYAYWLDAPVIAGTSISLNGDVTTNIYVSLTADIADYQSAVVKIGYYTEEFDLKDPEECTVETINGNQYYKVSYKQYFTEMTSGFDIDLVCNNTICNTVGGFSVKSYADDIINGEHDAYLKSTADLSDAKLEKLKELCKSMLNLGAMAQLQFDTNKWDLANDGLDYSAPAIDPETLVEPDYTAAGAKCHATAMYTTDNSVKFINKENWGKVYLWYYDDDWNEISVEMEKTDEQKDGSDVYSAVLPGGYERDIWFTDATDSSSFYNKTEMYYFYNSEGYGYYYYPDGGYGYDEYYYWYLSHDAPDSKEIRFINTLNWDKVYVWTVGGEAAFPGVEMTYLETNEDGDKVYTAQSPDSNAELVFSDGTEENAASSVKLAAYYQYPDDYASKSLGGNVIPAWKAVPGDVFSSYGITYEGSNVGLFNQMAYGIMLRNDSAEGLTVSRNGKVLEGTRILFNLDDSYLMYRIFDIPAAEITDGVDLTVHVDKVTDVLTGQETTPGDKTVKFSPVSYIKRALMLRGSNYESLRNTVTALYDFGQKAKDYFAAV